MGRFAVGEQWYFALGPLYCWWCFTSLGTIPLQYLRLSRLLGVLLLYLMPLWVRVKLTDDTDIADVADAGNRESRAKVLSTGTK